MYSAWSSFMWRMILVPLFSSVSSPDGEGSSSAGLPDVQLVIVVLGVDHHLVRHQVGRVETYSELTNHADVSSCSQSLHEGLGAGLGDGSQVVDHVRLSHANTSVNDCESLGFWI